jgi:arylsulfatase A-like enzyme
VARGAWQSGVRGVASLAALLLGLACHAGSGAPPNIVLVVLDTTRADHLSLYGYPRETSPALSRLAREAVVFDRAYATSSWTLASHASLFTGLLPMTHRATQEYLYLDDELDTLAELLGERGYRSAAFSNNSWISRATNLTQGFDEIAPLWREEEVGPDAAASHPTVLRILDWLRARDPARPFFLFVNLIEPHWPYEAPLAWQERFVDPRTSPKQIRRSNFPDTSWYTRRRRLDAPALELRIELYDAELAYADAVVGELVAGLRALDLLDTCLLVVTSDHGENLGEKGHHGHAFTLYDSTLRVPLLIRRPRGVDGGRRRTDAAQLPDVFVTLARAAGAAHRDERVVGRDLMAGPAADREVVGEYYRPDTYLSRFPGDPAVQSSLDPYRRRLRSIQIGSDKLIWGSDGRHELYDVGVDPGEEVNRIDVDPETARRLEQRLSELRARLERPVGQRANLLLLDEETRAHLRELGYLP